MKSIRKNDRTQLVRMLLEKQMWCLEDAQACLKVAVRYHRRDLVELLLDCAVDLTEPNRAHRLMHDASIGRIVSTVSLLVNRIAEVPASALQY
jgi:hypothetical protein